MSVSGAAAFFIMQQLQKQNQDFIEQQMELNKKVSKVYNKKYTNIKYKKI